MNIICDKIKLFFTKTLLITFFILLFLFINLSELFAVSFSQIEIPLSNKNGIPFVKTSGDYLISGFDVDENGNLFFLGGGKTTLMVFSSDKKKITLRRNYDAFQSNKIKIINNKLYIFDEKYRKNNLFIIDANNGNIVQQYLTITKEKYNDAFFIDNCLMLRVYNNKNNKNLPMFHYLKYDLQGQFIEMTNKTFDLPDAIANKLNDKVLSNYLGKWENYFVFCEFEFKEMILQLVDSNGMERGREVIKRDSVGKPLYEAQNGGWILKNDDLYYFGRDGGKVIISKFRLEDIRGK